MDKERVKSVGVSFLGGHSGIEGHYQLAIDSIRAVNEEDADIPGKPLTLLSPSTIDRPAQKMIHQRALGGNEIEVPSDS